MSNAREMEGKTVVITGASMGIGEALAKLYAEAGASVLLSSRDLKRVEEARRRIGHVERTAAATCDVAHREDVELLARTAIKHFGKIDVWINNAGFGLVDTVVEMDRNACRSMFDTN